MKDMDSALSRDAHALHAHRFLMRAGLALANSFAWIFVFSYFYALSGSPMRSIAAVALMYGFSQAITLLFTPLSAAHLQAGTRRSLVWGTILAAASFTCLGVIFTGLLGEAPQLWTVTAFALLLGAYRALYWVPYQVHRAGGDSARFRGQWKYEGVIAFIPLFAGITLVSLPFSASHLLFGAAALIALSILPVLTIADAHERFSWPFAYTFKQLVRRRHRTLVLGSFLDGLQGAGLFLIWPLAVFLIIGGSYLLLGLIFTATLLAILILRGLYKRFLSSLNLDDSPTLHVVIAVSAWVGRLAAGTPIGVIIADTYSYASMPVRGTSADPFVAEQSADRGSFVDEYTALKEMAMAVGRIALCIVVGVLVLSTPIAFAFAVVLVLAGLASGASVIFARRAQAAAY